MSLKEQTIILTDQDVQGNTIMQFPITKAGLIEDIMSIAQGGTGAVDKTNACNNLGLDWDYLHRYGVNFVPSDVTNVGWNKLGLFLSYYTQNLINNQPTQYGQLLNIPATKNFEESTQIWIHQPSGDLFVRGGNGSIIVNDTPFIKIARISDINAATTNGIIEQSANHVKFANGFLLMFYHFSSGGVKTVYPNSASYWAAVHTGTGGFNPGVTRNNSTQITMQNVRSDTSMWCIGMGWA